MYYKVVIKANQHIGISGFLEAFERNDCIFKSAIMHIVFIVSWKKNDINYNSHLLYK